MSAPHTQPPAAARTRGPLTLVLAFILAATLFLGALLAGLLIGFHSNLRDPSPKIVEKIVEVPAPQERAQATPPAPKH